MDTKLKEEDRIKLDSIVSKMVANKESDSNIKFVVDDFKKLYGQKEQEKEKTFLQKAQGVLTKIFPGKEVGEAIGTSIARGQLGTTIQKAVTGRDITPEEESKITSETTPGRVAADIAQGALMVAGPKIPGASSVIGKAAQLGTIGGASSGLSAISEGKPTEEVLSETGSGALTGAVTGATLGLVEKGIKGLSNLLGKTGDKVMTTVIKPTQKDIKDGFSIETVKKYNLGGSLKKTFEKTDETLDSLSKQLNTKLTTNKNPVDLNEVYEKTAKRLLGNKLESFGSNAQMDSAIEKLQNEIIAVSGKNGLVSIPEGQLIKRAAGHFGAWTYGVPTPEATASQKVYDTFYNELKTAIEKASPEGVKQLNQEISKLIPVMNALIRRIPVAERNAALSLTDIITMTGAVLEPRALGLSLLNLASKSGTVGSALSKAPGAGKVISGAIEKAEPIVRTIIAGE